MMCNRLLFRLGQLPLENLASVQIVAIALYHTTSFRRVRYASMVLMLSMLISRTFFLDLLSFNQYSRARTVSYFLHFSEGLITFCNIPKQGTLEAFLVKHSVPSTTWGNIFIQGRGMEQ